MLNEYQKKLIAEGFYARLMAETSPNKRVLLILELMESFSPMGLPSTIPTIRDCTRFGQPIDKAPEQWYQDVTIPPPAFTATKKDC